MGHSMSASRPLGTESSHHGATRGAAQTRRGPPCWSRTAPWMQAGYKVSGVVHVHLPKSRDPVRQRPGLPEQKLQTGEMTLNLVLKSDLGTRKEADSYPRSSIAENPRVVVFQNCVVTSLSPTLAGLVATPCKL
jgi:hypothetical protein